MLAPVIKVCLFCEKEFNARKGRELTRARNRKYCSRKCSTRHIATWAHGENHHSWKHGLKIDKDRYIAIRTYLGPKRKHTIKYLHRAVMEEYLGRPLKFEEEVHHIDGNKHNNNPQNLMVLSKSEHTKIHWQTNGTASL